MTYLRDTARHLICLPYTRANLHRMADDLGIGRHFFHPAPVAHYDIPARRRAELEADPRIGVISSRELVRITRATSRG